ncbi:MAG: helix-turn-helix transcriptional regulator [Clostridiales bacterium]|nr:helix-turn-helix transcriptional regulator [Clostridiales bacterium]
MKRFHPTLIKIVSAFTIITVLPIVVIVAFFYPLNHSLLNTNIQHSFSDYAQNATEALDKELEAIYQAGADLKSTLIYRFIDDDSYHRKVVEIFRSLQTAGNYSELVEQVLLLNPAGEQVYTSSGTINKKYFMNQLYSFEEEGAAEEFLSSLQPDSPSVFHAKGISYTSKDTPSPYTLISFPINTTYGWAVFFIPESRLQKTISSVSEQERNYLLVNDSVVFLSNADTISTKEMLEYLEQEEPSSSFTTVHSVSRLFHFQFQVFERNSLLYAELNQLITVTVILLLLILAAGFFSMFYIIRSNYKPLISILRNFSSDQTDSQSSAFKTEFDVIQAGISDIRSDNLTLSSTLETYRNNYKILFLYEFLSQSIQSINDVATIEERLEIELYGRILIPVFLQFSVSDSDDLKQNFVSSAESLNHRYSNMDSELQAVFSVCMEKQALFCLISTNLPESSIDKKLVKWIKEEIYSLPETICLGSCCALIGGQSGDIYEVGENLRILYQVTNPNLLQTLGEYSVSDIQNLKLSQTDQPYLFKHIYNLTHAVDERNLEEINNCTEIICQTLLSSQNSADITKLLFEQAMFILDAASGNTKTNTEKHYNQESFSVNRMADILRKQCLTLSHAFAEETKSIQKHHRNITTYIDEHFMDIDFSITVAAEHYHMQVSNFSTYFKKCYNITFQQYTTQKRMELAQSLLLETDMGLELISDRLGYANASSFGRSFKRVVGMTPGDYREQHCR